MHLTSHEQTILGLIARGRSDRAIAEELDISLSTARKHRENLLAKFEVSKSSQLVVRYFADYGVPLKKMQQRLAPRQFRCASWRWSSCCCKA
ncbi:response regulator transcription factor [Pseudoduganella violacea]|uniref:DNA-binding CsgD family transcriptional regulator n=1 Tax=Pseudoduganella violacea TaxID=1715466 RepID=A0A7W5BED5_9BURK|nr:LuxR C-terminal-related transcriptional regulator [Pseudoduganella violacea]MBB3121574.1 DNA-binding CsgD family transcriptional regulator [Pseudoduganella violacea]